ncbi:hypothetical protein ACFLZH_00245 [Patescibacteria group bacterium]
MFTKLMMCVAAMMMVVSLPRAATATPAKKPLELTDISLKGLPAAWQARYPKLKVLRASLLALKKQDSAAEKELNKAKKKLQKNESKVKNLKSDLYQYTNLLKCLLIPPKIRKWHPFAKCTKRKLNRSKVRAGYLIGQEVYAVFSLRTATSDKAFAQKAKVWFKSEITTNRKGIAYWQEFMRAVQQEMKLIQKNAYELDERKDNLKYAKLEIKTAKKKISICLKTLQEIKKSMPKIKKEIRQERRRVLLAKKVRKLMMPLIKLEGAKLQATMKKTLRRLKPKVRRQILKKMRGFDP